MDSEEDRGSEVSQIEDQEDQSLKFDFHVNVFNIKVQLNRAHIRNILNNSFMYPATRICLIICSCKFFTLYLLVMSVVT